MKKVLIDGSDADEDECTAWIVNIRYVIWFGGMIMNHNALEAGCRIASIINL